MTVPTVKKVRRARLPWRVRVRIYGLLSEGTPPDEILQDPEIAALPGAGSINGRIQFAYQHLLLFSHHIKV